MVIAACIYHRHKFINKKNLAGFTVKPEMKQIFMYSETLIKWQLQKGISVYHMGKVKADSAKQEIGIVKNMLSAI